MQCSLQPQMKAGNDATAEINKQNPECDTADDTVRQPSFSQVCFVV